MAGFVVDASVTLPWCFADEATPWTEALLDRLAAGEEAVVPAHWPLEVINGLLMAMRRGRVASEKVHQFIEDLDSLLIHIEPPLQPSAWAAVLELAVKHRLTAYDAAYLELAQRNGLLLATVDNDLEKAATAIGVRLVEGR